MCVFRIAMNCILLSFAIWCCSIPYQVLTSKVFDPSDHLDKVDLINLQTFEQMYPLSQNVSIIVMPQSISGGKDGKIAVEKFVVDLLGNLSDVGLVVGVSTSSSQVLFLNSNASPGEASVLYDQIRSRSEQIMQYSALDGIKQLLNDLHCFTNFKSIDNQSIMINSSRFLWEPVFDLISLVSAMCLIFIQHAVTAIASLPSVGNPKSSKSQLIVLILERWPWTENILSLLLFCATSIFASSVAALVFCVGLFLCQSFLFVYKCNKSNDKRTKNVNRSELKTGKSEMISSVSRFRDMNGVRTTTTTSQTSSSKVSTVIERKVSARRK